MNRAPLLIAAVLSAALVYAQKPTDPAPDQYDPPARVARLNWINGDVSFQPAGLEEWTSAILNYPLSLSDHLYTGKDSRAEIHIGPNAIRLDANSNFGFLNLDDSIVQVSLTEGSLEIHLRVLAEDDSFEIATPNGAITLLRAGDYRIDTDPVRDASMLTVRNGQAELFFAGATSMIVRSQETAYFKTDQSPEVRSANTMDEFDTFATKRDDAVPAEADPSSRRRGDDVTVAELAAEGMTGAEDLSTYGSWENNTPYGPAWVPPVDANWVPYSDGNWAYQEPWGWTWIDSAPWGFAPFHYGRWVYASYHWVWVPGPRRQTQVYAPALVTFIGGGPADNVSWIPLGPRDLWIPPWRIRTDNPIPARLSSNRWAPGAVVSMSPMDFTAGSRVRPISGLGPQGQVIGSSPNIAPVRDSILVKPSRLRPLTSNRPLIARTAPPAPPLTFAMVATLLAVNPGRPLQPKQLEAVRRQIPKAAMQTPQVRYTKPLAIQPQHPSTKPADRPKPITPPR